MQVLRTKVLVERSVFIAVIDDDLLLRFFQARTLEWTNEERARDRGRWGKGPVLLADGGAMRYGPTTATKSAQEKRPAVDRKQGRREKVQAGAEVEGS